jgi:hypothetical protein
VLPHTNIRSQAGIKEKGKENKGNERKRKKRRRKQKKSRNDGRLQIHMHYLCWCKGRILVEILIIW